MTKKRKRKTRIEFTEFLAAVVLGFVSTSTKLGVEAARASVRDLVREEEVWRLLSLFEEDPTERTLSRAFVGIIKEVGGRDCNDEDREALAALIEGWRSNPLDS